MTKQNQPDWDPRSPEVLRDQRAAYDKMRESCPVAYSEFMQWSLFRHEDVWRVLHDTASFSNAVSSHLSVPNGMDPSEHTEYRRVIEKYFEPRRMAAFEPALREVAAPLMRAALTQGDVELMEAVALPFAVRAQCAFLGWPTRLWEPLARWTKESYQATLSQDRPALSKLAREFEAIIDAMLEERSAHCERDTTADLMRDEVWGRPLSNEEIASILRNWTVGETATLASSVGILAHFLAQNKELQKQLRAQPSLLPAAIDEILRIHGPLVSSRRVARTDVEIGGRKIAAGERITLHWIAANRDGRVFEEPNSFRWDRDTSKNLLYGAGIHVCPGAPLARLEMRVAMEELLAQTTLVELADQPPVNAVYPASGFSILPLRMR